MCACCMCPPLVTASGRLVGVKNKVWVLHAWKETGEAWEAVSSHTVTLTLKKLPLANVFRHALITLHHNPLADVWSMEHPASMADPPPIKLGIASLSHAPHSRLGQMLFLQWYIKNNWDIGKCRSTYMWVNMRMRHI